MAKRTFDIVVSFVALLAASPIIAVLAIWIRLDSEGPAFFRQPRVGRGGRIFEIYKLRSMVVNAAEIGGYSTFSGDPRITRAGSFVRRTSLDELPQLLNVLKGDMSLVGPRPDTPMQRANYRTEDWQRRHAVRPGITGLAQARLRSAATLEQRLALDLAYVRAPGLLRDLAIIGETLVTLLSRKTI
jgi:lipopolysaccharide/colanic/teichoic acid biosynthesis glycosyltransferase